jgi:hypothetical protein
MLLVALQPQLSEVLGYTDLRMHCRNGGHENGPGRAFEAGGGIPPLDLKIEDGALAGICRLSYNDQRRPKSLWRDHARGRRNMTWDHFIEHWR